MAFVLLWMEARVKVSNMLKGHYLIAGATGLMGTTALLRLQNQPGVTVKATYHQRQPKIFAGNIHYVKADLRNADDCKRVVEGIDYVCMFAAILSTAPVIAKNPVSHITLNMIMNAVLLEAAYFAGVKKFLFMSSCTGYPELERPLKEEDMFYADPADVYFSVGWMSRYSEVLCRMYATKLKNPLSIIILRPTSIYGEYEDFHFETCHILPALVRKVIERQDPIKIWGTGENARDFVYADDVFDACLLTLEKADNFDVFNIASGRQYSINELLKIILELDHYTDAQVIYNTSKPSTINRQIVDFTKVQGVLGFKPKTSLRQGVTRMIEWYKKSPILT